MAKQHDGFGLQPTAWRLTPDANDPPHYAEARALGREQAEAILARAEADKFRDDVEWLRGELSDGDASGFPHGSSICLQCNPHDPESMPQAVSVHVFPLSPMMVDEAVSSGLFPHGRFAWHVYERMVKVAGLEGFVGHR
jgi:hypothetical protein